MKPRAVCQTFLDDPLRQLYWESAKFTQDLASHGLACRPATLDDLEPLFAFLGGIWKEPTDIEPKPVLARALRHGFSLLLTDLSGAVVGAQVAELFADRTLSALRYALAPPYRGFGLGTGLVRQHAFDGMLLHGARCRRGRVELENLPSLVTLLNQVGCVADAYETWEGFAPLLSVTLDLTPVGLVANRIDQAKAVEWVEERLTNPHRLVGWPRAGGLMECYLEGRQIIGVLPTGQLLAVEEHQIDASRAILHAGPR